MSTDTFDRQFAVDARGWAALIAEFARRHEARHATWGRIIGLTSGGPNGFPGEVSYGAAKAALENYTVSAASSSPVSHHREHRPPASDRHRLDTDDVRRHVAGQPDSDSHSPNPARMTDIIAFLASDEARLITGNVIHLR